MNVAQDLTKPVGGTWAAPDLSGQVAVVTGATRGVGRGIAEVLGQCGATVYVVGRSTRSEPTLVFGDIREPEWSIDAAAEAVTELGGTGIPYRCDVSHDEQIAELFAAVARDQGRLDIVVANAVGSDMSLRDQFRAMSAPVWKKPIAHWDANLTVGVRSSFVTWRLALPLMLDTGGLLVMTSEMAPHPDPIYDLRAVAAGRLAETVGAQLQDRPVTCLCLVPGDAQTHSRRRGSEHQAFEPGQESVFFTGRAVAALAADDEGRQRWNGQTVRVADCATSYKFTDITGEVPG